MGCHDASRSHYGSNLAFIFLEDRYAGLAAHFSSRRHCNIHLLGKPAADERFVYGYRLGKGHN
jgi:hypothetical protein